MGNLNLYQVYKQKLHKNSLNDNSRFQDSFVDAVNNTFAELNSLVFGAQSLQFIDSFDDVIDKRLRLFTTITYDSDANAAISDREFWEVEYDFEKLSDTNGFTHTISDDASNVVITIADNVFSVVGDSVSGSVTLPSSTLFTVKFESHENGNRLFVDGEQSTLEYTVGDSGDTQSIGTVSTNVISGVSGFTLNRTIFSSPNTQIYDFLINEGTSTTITDLVAGFKGTIAGQEWQTVNISPSTSIDDSYRSVVSIGIDYHLQEGGEWSLESDDNRYLKWYGDPARKGTGAVQMARRIYQQSTPYINPLGI